jgi:hypothetical protein
MTKFTQLALAGAVLLIGASSAIAQSNAPARAANGQSWSTEADPYGGHSPNSAQGNRAFWDYHGRHGN